MPDEIETCHQACAVNPEDVINIDDIINVWGAEQCREATDSEPSSEDYPSSTPEEDPELAWTLSSEENQYSDDSTLAWCSASSSDDELVLPLSDVIGIKPEALPKKEMEATPTRAEHAIAGCHGPSLVPAPIWEVKPRIRRRKVGAGSKHSLGGRPVDMSEEREGHLKPIAFTPELLQACFGMPLHEAARTLGICATAVKKCCRKMGIKQWPYQRLKPIHIRLAKLQAGASTPEVQREIEALQAQQRALLESQPQKTIIKASSVLL